MELLLKTNRDYNKDNDLGLVAAQDKELAGHVTRVMRLDHGLVSSNQCSQRSKAEAETRGCNRFSLVKFKLATTNMLKKAFSTEARIQWISHGAVLDLWMRASALSKAVLAASTKMKSDKAEWRIQIYASTWQIWAAVSLVLNNPLWLTVHELLFATDLMMQFCALHEDSATDP